MNSFGKDAAQLEREAEEQRRRVGDRINEIRERLSPGQLIDEVLSYTKNDGQQFVANFGSTIANNPLPAALVGIGLAWLMSGQGGPRLGAAHASQDWRREEPDYPYATVAGGIAACQP